MYLTTYSDPYLNYDKAYIYNVYWCFRPFTQTSARRLTKLVFIRCTDSFGHLLRPTGTPYSTSLKAYTYRMYRCVWPFIETHRHPLLESLKANIYIRHTNVFGHLLKPTGNSYSNSLKAYIHKAYWCFWSFTQAHRPPLLELHQSLYL